MARGIVFNRLLFNTAFIGLVAGARAGIWLPLNCCYHLKPVDSAVPESELNFNDSPPIRPMVLNKCTCGSHPGTVNSETDRLSAVILVF